MENVVAVFIPIVSILVVGLVLVTFFYFRSKEKQMMIDKGLSYEQMMDLLKMKTDHLISLKAGIVIFFFGIGLGLGFVFENWTSNEEWIPFFIITFIGLGFITSHLISRKVKNGQR
jgi:hypothetical protein